MKQYRYICDGGALMLGCDDFKCHYMNDYGDGEHNLFVFVSESEFNDVYQAFKFVGHVSGKINVYYYDCDDDDVIVQLDGLYAVYAKRNSGDMALVRWG